MEEITLDLELDPLIRGWKPFGNQVRFEDDKRSGSFSVISLVPKARALGRVSIGHADYVVSDATGYHDHTFWQTGKDNAKGKRKLYVDDTLARWEFGKFVSSKYLVIFDTLHFRPWLKQQPIVTLMIARNNRIIHSSNNIAQYRYHGFMNCSY